MVLGPGNPWEETVYLKNDRLREKREEKGNSEKKEKEEDPEV